MAFTLLCALVVTIDGRDWHVECRSDNPEVLPPPPSACYWVVRDGSREAVIEGAPPWSPNVRAEYWRELLTPRVKRTITARGW